MVWLGNTSLFRFPVHTRKILIFVYSDFFAGDTTTMVGSSSPNNLALNNSGHGAVSPVEGSNPGAANLSSTNMSNMSTSSIFDSPGDDSRPSRRQYSNRSKFQVLT